MKNEKILLVAEYVDHIHLIDKYTIHYKSGKTRTYNSYINLPKTIREFINNHCKETIYGGKTISMYHIH